MSAAISAVRFGYGLPASGAEDAASVMAALRGPDTAARSWPGLGMDRAIPLYHAAATARALARSSEAARADYREKLKAVEEAALTAAQTTMARAVGSADGFRERLVQFWADHFTVVGRFRQDRVLPPAMVEAAIRPHVAGRFSDMLRAVVLHPAMLIYLDQVLSVGPNSVVGQRKKRGLNENLARELIELHTMGVSSGYSQTDVREMAKLLTGLTVDPALGQVFIDAWAEPGAETVLGRSYGGAGVAPVVAALNDLALRPETAQHIAGKLVTHFVTDLRDDPAVTALVEGLAGVWQATQGDLGAVSAALLEHPVSRRPAMEKAKQPFDFVVTALRALSIDGNRVAGLNRGAFRRHLLLPLELMGQPFGKPQGPDGWPEEPSAWITPQGMAARIQWALEAPVTLLQDLPDPVEFARHALGDLASARLIWAVARAENRREGVALVLASPEFNRR
jgi:uncharacterized protein (DUF1800 family)